jgi:hypothetical protein
MTFPNIPPTITLSSRADFARDLLFFQPSCSSQLVARGAATRISLRAPGTFSSASRAMLTTEPPALVLWVAALAATSLLPLSSAVVTRSSATADDPGIHFSASSLRQPSMRSQGRCHPEPIPGVQQWGRGARDLLFCPTVTPIAAIAMLTTEPSALILWVAALAATSLPPLSSGFSRCQLSRPSPIFRQQLRCHPEPIPGVQQWGRGARDLQFVFQFSSRFAASSS